MAVHPGQEAEYERRHRPIWSELEDVLLAHGVATYSIYLDEASRDLFAYGLPPVVAPHARDHAGKY